MGGEGRGRSAAREGGRSKVKSSAVIVNWIRGPGAGEAVPSIRDHT